MSIQKPKAGQSFPSITMNDLQGGTRDLSKPNAPYDWQMVVVYRGKHCPLCTRYLSELNTLLPEFHALGIDVVAVSADTEVRAKEQISQINPNFNIAYGLTIEQMQTLGLYISNPRSQAEYDRPFAEPGLFVINAEGNIQIVDISNAPFVRPELTSLLMGLKFIRNPENNYPVRGTY
ncbi:peroxiredoxin-like family protein [Agarilytica rhodophyticola]|uniref:peroxiredoxin-like family protein n=1 Tax=Agarilytica rhodophyticola TaxID=1737490 RepID=UPI000B3487A7|nr:peroxiredoxin-like family protein [Agarilytica rhodophyticola]